MDRISNIQTSLPSDRIQVYYSLSHQKRFCGPKIQILALAGYSSLKESFSFGNFKYDTTIGTFTFGLGGALEIKLSENIDLRLIQVDYILTGFNNRVQNDFRLSAGVMIEFKQKWFVKSLLAPKNKYTLGQDGQPIYP